MLSTEKLPEADSDDEVRLWYYLVNCNCPFALKKEVNIRNSKKTNDNQVKWRYPGQNDYTGVESVPATYPDTHIYTPNKP